MKNRYLNIILTIIAILLLSVSLHLIHLKALLTIFNQSSQAIINSNNLMINSNQRLENNLSELRKQIEKISDNYSKK
jgi:predicted PurR-regulated permease PerM